MKLALLLCSAAAVSAFAPAGPPPAQLRSSSPVMSEAQSTRRAMLASAILLAPAAANVRGLRAHHTQPHSLAAVLCFSPRFCDVPLSGHTRDCSQRSVVL